MLFYFFQAQRKTGGGGGWSARGGGFSDRPYSGGYQQQQQHYGMMNPYMQQHPQMAYQGQQQIVNEYAGMDYDENYGGRSRGRRGGRGARRPY